MSRHWLGYVAVAAVALAATVAGLRNGFVQDDVVLIVENTRVHHLASWWRLFALPYWPPPWSEDLYRPLTSVLLAGQYVAGDGGPLAFRLASGLLYAGAALAFLRLASRMLPWGGALGAAALFAAHPVHVEAVALAVAQNELLVGLLALVMTAWYLDRRRTGGGALGRLDWAGLGVLYLAASLLKEQGLILPAFLLAAEVALVPRSQPRRGLAPGFVALAMLGAAVLLVRTQVLGEVAGTFTAEALEGVGAGGRALTMLRVVPEWGRLLAWPAHLQADYSPQELVASTTIGPLELLGLGIGLGGLVVAWLARRKAPEVTFALLWTGLALLPVSNVLVPTGILLAERTLFLPSIGFVLLLGAVASRMAASMPAPATGIGLGIITAALALAGVARSAGRQATWRDEATFTLHGVDDAPRSYRMQKAFGQLLFDNGRPEEGYVAYERAIALSPPRAAWRVRNDLARRLWEFGADTLAFEQLKASAASAPDQVEARHYLVLGYLTLGDYSGAARAADAALADGLAPDTFRGLRALADSAARDGAPAGSIRIRVVRPGGPKP